jgi:nucleotide-binding universal stress UspA family protein
MTAIHDRPDEAATERALVGSDQAVVVGVDGSGRNDAAVDWATHETDTTGQPLTLVASGGTVRSLLRRSADAGLLVLGKRGPSTFARSLIGSTSIAVAGRSRVPVVIVPDGWRQTDHTREAVVVGVNPGDLHPEALRYAFTEAHRRSVRLVVAHGWENPSTFPMLSVAAAMTRRYREDDARNQVRAAVAPLRAEFRDLRVELHHGRGHPAGVLLEASAQGQLLVVGRHDRGPLGGFPFGSVTRSVLHHAEVPVIVVPSGSDRT